MGLYFESYRSIINKLSYTSKSPVIFRVQFPKMNLTFVMPKYCNIYTRIEAK